MKRGHDARPRRRSGSDEDAVDDDDDRGCENYQTIELAEEIGEGTFIIPGDDSGTVLIDIQDLPYLEGEDDIVVLSIEDEDGGEGETFILQAD